MTNWRRSYTLEIIFCGLAYLDRLCLPMVASPWLIASGINYTEIKIIKGWNIQLFQKSAILAAMTISWEGEGIKECDIGVLEIYSILHFHKHHGKCICYRDLEVWCEIWESPFDRRCYPWLGYINSVLLNMAIFGRRFIYWCFCAICKMIRWCIDYSEKVLRHISLV